MFFYVIISLFVPPLFMTDTTSNIFTLLLAILSYPYGFSYSLIGFDEPGILGDILHQY